MIFNLEKIAKDVKELANQQNANQETSVGNTAEVKSIDETINDEMKSSNYVIQKEDARFITKCYKYLRKLGLCESQYQFSTRYLNKSKYYYSVILCEQRSPSIDAVNNLIKNIGMINDGLTKQIYLNKLYEEGEKIITKRLLKYL